MKFLCFLLLLVPCIEADSVLMTNILNTFLTFVKSDNASSLFDEGIIGIRIINNPEFETIDVTSESVTEMFANVSESLQAKEVFEMWSIERNLEDGDALRVQTWLRNKQAYFNFIFNWRDTFKVVHLDFVTPNSTFSIV